jgi:hypothetical protein
MVHINSRRFIIAVSLAQFRDTPCGICGGKSGIPAAVPLERSFFSISNCKVLATNGVVK